MRLTRSQQQIIRETTAEVFGADAAVFVFGSRIDDDARGGDLDLLIQSAQPVAEQGRKALQLMARLQMRLGDQPIDVLVLDPLTERKPIHDEAVRKGISL
jgi:predicted nucleotidyltransferase